MTGATELKLFTSITKLSDPPPVKLNPFRELILTPPNIDGPAIGST